jgi:hypothetical protein
MKPKDAFKGGYGCVPRQMHTAWQRVSYLARALGRDLLSRVDDFETMRISTSGEWMSSLCLLLQVNGGNDRRIAKSALAQLVQHGLISVGDGFVTVNQEPIKRSECSRDVSPMSVVCLSGVSGTTEVPENTQVTFDSKQAIKQVEERVHVPAREPTGDLVDLRPPVQTSSPAAKRAADKLHAITLRWYDPRSDKHREALEAIGERPDGEWAKAAAVIELELTKPGVAGMMTPTHLLANWGKYSNGEAPVGRGEIQRRREREAKPEARGVWAKAVAQ